MRDLINLVENNDPILALINRAKAKFGQNALYGGNCGQFALALSSILALPDLRVIIICEDVFDDDAEVTPRDIIAAETRIYHVAIAHDGAIYDGDGVVSRDHIADWIEEEYLDDAPAVFEYAPGEVGALVRSETAWTIPAETFERFLRVQINEGVRDDVRAFSDKHNNPVIDQRVQQQAARRHPKWKQTLTSMMERHGFRLVGAGINGAVFQHDGYPYVLKVYRNDRAYDEWLQFSRTHRSNPYVPQIKGSPRRLNSIFSVVRLEILQPCDTARANEFIDAVQSDMESYERVADSEHPDRRTLANFFRDWEPAFDLTAHNMMQRPNGDLVIVDPLYLEPGREIDW